MEQKPLDELAIEVTYSCSQNCIMCSSSACFPSPKQNELTTAEIKKLLSDTAKTNLKPKNFSLSGGDPLQRTDVFEIMKYANDLGMKNLLYTTGQIIEDNKKTAYNCIFLKADCEKSITQAGLRKMINRELDEGTDYQLKGQTYLISETGLKKIKNYVKKQNERKAKNI